MKKFLLISTAIAAGSAGAFLVANISFAQTDLRHYATFPGLYENDQTFATCIERVAPGTARRYRDDKPLHEYIGTISNMLHLIPDGPECYYQVYQDHTMFGATEYQDALFLACAVYAFPEVVDTQYAAEANYEAALQNVRAALSGDAAVAYCVRTASSF